jgi:periplasmic protein TonB
MYYATKRKSGSQRIVGLIAVIAVNAGVFYVAASGLGAGIIREITETQVAIIEEVKQEEEPPPPPPPVDVDLPPPPPQVQLPDFVFERPPAPTAITAEMSPKPQPQPEARPAPPAVPAVPPSCRVGTPCNKKMAELMAEYYPSASVRAEEEGSVKVTMCVAADGRISDVKLVQGSGHPRLDEATIKFLPKMKTSPAKDSAGKPAAWCNPPFLMEVVWQLQR